MNSNIIYVIITGVLIALIVMVKQTYITNKEDPFVGKVPVVPLGNGQYRYGFIPGVYPTGQPMMYPEQLYPKDPYYADSINHIGRPCNGPNGCGVFGSCNNGVCKVKDQHDTVFDINV